MNKKSIQGYTGAKEQVRMKCPKCGEDCNSGVFCDACGCDLREGMKKDSGGSRVYSGEKNGYLEYKDLQPHDGNKPARVVKKHRKGDVVSVVIAVTLLVIVALAGVFIYQTFHMEPYERKLDEIADLFNERVADIDKYGGILLPGNIWEDFTTLLEAEYEDLGKNPEDMRADFNAGMKSVMDSLNESFGDSFEVEFKVRNARELGSDELSEIEASYAQASQIINVFSESGDVLSDEGKIKSYEAYKKLMDDFTAMKLEEGYELEVTFIMKTDEEERENTNNIIMVKTSDEWMIDFMSNVDELNSIFNQYLN